VKQDVQPWNLAKLAVIGMCGRVRRPNRRQISLICTQPSGEITNGAAEQADIACQAMRRANYSA
jgi:hypothetical protein